MIPSIRPDRANHFIYGALVFVLAASAVRLLGASVEQARIAGLSASVTAGVAKEIFDRWANRRAVARGEPPPHGVERADAAWTAFGGLVVLAGSIGSAL